MELRPYQAECIETIEAQPPGAFLAQMATGLGKTVTFANIPRHGERMLILSHREELVEQPRKYFNCSYGIERAQQHSHGEEVVSASIQTLVRRLDNFNPEDFRLIICDEAHHAAASTYRKIFDYFRPEKLIGFTATPIGAWKASLENAKEQYIRDAVNEAMGSDAYKAAEAEGNAAEMGRIIMKAKIDGMNQYNANEGKDEVLAQELSLIDSVREDTSLNDSYWDAGYTLGQSFSKGRAAGMMGSGSGETSASASPSRMLQGVTLPSGGSYAVGIDYVPYDNFPALLHQGERVQTAEEARSDGSGTSIQIVMNGTVIREDADVERVASALLERMELAGMRG